MFDVFFLFFPLPLQTAIVLAILWQELGPSCLAGIMLLILFVPLQSELYYDCLMMILYISDVP